MTAKKKYSNSNVSHLRFVNKNLRNANFQDAICCGTDFSNCNLKNANFQNANLTQANFKEANLEQADFYMANLQGADLRGANLKNAVFHMAKLAGAKLPKFQIPQGKSLIGYKKLVDRNRKDFLIAQLRIPARAKRTASLMMSGKCRAEYAIVEKIYAYHHHNGKTKRTPHKRGRSVFDPLFPDYVVGAKVAPTSPFDGDIRIECASGIHFFLSEREALDYR